MQPLAVQILVFFSTICIFWEMLLNSQAEQMMSQGIGKWYLSASRMKEKKRNHEPFIFKEFVLVEKGDNSKCLLFKWPSELHIVLENYTEHFHCQPSRICAHFTVIIKKPPCILAVNSYFCDLHKNLRAVLFKQGNFHGQG